QAFPSKVDGVSVAGLIPIFAFFIETIKCGGTAAVIRTYDDDQLLCVVNQRRTSRPGLGIKSNRKKKKKGNKRSKHLFVFCAKRSGTLAIYFLTSL
ncbi:MAG: hypothetical protein KDD27_03010, partial [Saprospiraceae bacterium]|nr:hypothetical protein [Saprospiraceae bacterium]